ncbi:MAG: OmpA family protein [Ferruginibacter sp.]|nr:OmpA family protein [Cytophagales bacterium]
MKEPRFLLGFFFLLWLTSAAGSVRAQGVQWASEVLDFSSEYHDPKYTKEFRAGQVLGRPNKLPQFGSSFCAWSPASRGDTLGEWIKVGYRTPMPVRQIAVAESFNEGTVEKIILFDESDKAHEVYKNPRTDTVAALGRMLNVFVPLTAYKVKAVKLVLNTARIKGWNHLDAIGISSSDAPVKAEINVSASLPTDLQRENLGSSINTKAEEISPVISPDGKTLYFTRSPHPDNVGRADAQDVWYSVMEANNQWRPAVNVGGPINNDDQNSSFSITPDGNTMLLNNVYLPNGKMKRGLSITRKTGQGWEFPKEVKIANYYNDSEYSEFTLAQNGMVLIMTVQRKDTYGRKDLYVSFLQPDNTPNGGSWSEPRNMGAVANSAEDETSPFIASDGVSLYYSTAGFSGYGNNDMFVTKRLDDTWLNWSEPQNLGPKLNTPDWDAYFSIPASGEHAYFVSASNSLGEGDIFRVRLGPEVRPEPVVLVRGNVYNATTKQPLSADLIYHSLPDAPPAGRASAGKPMAPASTAAAGDSARKLPTVGMKASGRASTNPTTGEYQIVLPLKHEYNLMASAAGFISANATLDLTQYTGYQEIRKDLYLTPLEVGQKVALSSIAFEQSRHDLLVSSTPELDRMAQMMKRNPNLEIQLEGHTDNQGDWAKNLKLSEDRVREVKRYLVEHGVEEGRVHFKAYGSSQPVASNLNEISRQRNRRVEFMILKK